MKLNKNLFTTTLTSRCVYLIYLIRSYVIIVICLSQFRFATGTQFGTVVTLFVAGNLAASSWGWPSIFYFTGLSGLLWVVIWLVVGADDPDTHTTISEKEQVYITTTLTNNSSQSSVNILKLSQSIETLDGLYPVIESCDHISQHVPIDQ